jgi:hypothetical protein
MKKDSQKLKKDLKTMEVTELDGEDENFSLFSAC